MRRYRFLPCIIPMLLSSIALLLASLAHADEQAPSSVMRKMFEGGRSNFRMESGWGTSSDSNVSLLKIIPDELPWEHYTHVMLLAGSPQRALTTSWTGFVTVHEVESGRLIWRKQLAQGPISDAALLASGLKALVAGPTGDVTLVSLVDGSIERTYSVTPGMRITALAVSLREDVFAAGDVTGKIQIIAITTGETVTMLPSHTWPIMAMSFSSRDGYFYAADSTMIATYDWNRGVRLKSLPAQDSEQKFWFTSATFSQHEERVIVGSYDLSMSINLVTDETEREFHGAAGGTVRSKLYEHDTKLVTLSRDARLRVFDVESGTMEKELFLSTSWIPAVSDASIDLVTGHIALTTYEVDLMHFETRPYLRTYSFER